MSFINLHFYSESLRKNTEVFILCPYSVAKVQPWPQIPENGFPVLWLFHGNATDGSELVLDGDLESLARRKGMFIVVPTVQDYTGAMQWMGDYFSFATGDLVDYIRFLFPISARREDNFVAGLSFGGYFAYRVALTYADQYCSVGSFSSPLDIVMDIEEAHLGNSRYLQPDEVRGSDYELFTLARKLKEAGREIPKMYAVCGREDFTYKRNLSAKKYFESLGLDFTWKEGSGVHSWRWLDEEKGEPSFWLKSIHDFMNWLPVKDVPMDGKVGGKAWLDCI